MSSLLFPDTGTRLVLLSSGRPAVGARGYLYADAALTVPAEVYQDNNGSKGSLIAADEDGRVSIRFNVHGEQSDYWGPSDGTDRLWVVVNGVISVVDADYNARIDTAQAAAMGALAKAANLSDVANTATTRTNLGLGTAATRNVGTTSADVAAGDAPATAQALATSAAASDATTKVSTEATARAAADALLALYVNATDPAYGLSTGGSAAANSAALAAVQVAAAAAGKAAYVPPGTYNHNGFSVTTSIIGSPLSKTVLHGPAITLSSSGVELVDLKLVGSDSTIVVSAHCADVKWLRVETSHDNGVTDHLAWDAYDVDRMRVTDCKFGIGGLQLSLCDDFYIAANFWDCQYANVNEPCHISGQSSGQFVNNTVTNTATDAVDLYSSGHWCVISGNRFIGLRGAAGLECKVTMSDDPNNSSSAASVFEKTIIANNVFRDFNSSTTSTRTGIFATYIDSRATPAFAVAETNRGILISGNILVDFNANDPGNGSIVNYQAIAYIGHNGAITNNIIRNIRAWNGAVPIGISLASETADVSAGRKCVGVLVSNNHIAGVESSGGFGIRAGNLDACTVSNNIVRGDEVTGVQTKFGFAVTAGSSLNQCKVSNNIFECNLTSSFGIRAPDTTTTITECDFSGNILRHCGITVAKAVRSAFTGNTLNNATNGIGFTLGASGVTCLDVRLEGNHFTMNGSSSAIVMTNVDGFIANGNTFKSTTRAMFAFSATKNGIVSDNISRDQSVGSSPLVFDSTVSAADQASTFIGGGNSIQNGVTFVAARPSLIGSNTWLIDSVSELAYTSVTRNSNGAPTMASVTWPDGTTGTFTADTLSSAFPGTVDAYHVTYVGSTTKTVTQSAVTRDSASGLITAQPALVVT